MQHLRAGFLKKTRELLREATVKDFLNFLTVREIAGGPATAQFYKAFPGGRSELLDTLREEALPAKAGLTTPLTNQSVERLMQLVSDLKDRKPGAVAALREVALDDFDGYFDPDSDEVGDTFANLLAAAGKKDTEAEEQLRDYYSNLTTEYVKVYGILLGAIGRTPIPALGGVENLAMVITAIFDGLAIRARMGEPGKDVLAASLLPIVAALTIPEEESEPSDTELLYGAGVA